MKERRTRNVVRVPETVNANYKSWRVVAILMANLSPWKGRQCPDCFTVFTGRHADELAMHHSCSVVGVVKQEAP